MKILLLSSYLPYPLLSGGQVRLYNLIKELATQHEITLVCEKRPHQTNADIDAVKKICKKVITVNRKKQWSVKNIVQSGVSSQSFLVTGHTHPAMKQLITELLQKEAFDLIHVETFYVMQNLLESRIKNPEFKKIPIILVEHNIEYNVYQRFMDKAPVLLKPLLALDIAKIRRQEESCWEKATRVVAVSEEDKKVMEKAGITPIIVANGVNTELFSFRPKKETLLRQGFGGQGKILFMGDFSWIQNRDSVKFIIEEILPKIKIKLKSENVKPILWIVGRTIPDSIKSLTNDSNIIFDEESSAKPTPEIFHEASLLLAPIRVGGGTSYKILEAMSCGTPVVTMALSAKSINAIDNHDIMVGETPEELATKTIQLLQDAETYERISKNGRALVERKYTWKAIAKKLDAAYKELSV